MAKHDRSNTVDDKTWKHVQQGDSRIHADRTPAERGARIEHVRNMDKNRGNN